MQEQEQIEKEQRKNLILFFAISILIMVGYQHFFGNSGSENQTAVQEKTISADENLNSLRNGNNVAPIIKPIQHEVKNITIDAPRISGNLSSKGIKFHDVVLKNYTTQYDNDVLVSVCKDMECFAEQSWRADDESVILPDETSCWHVDHTELTPNSPVTLTWDNGAGLLFKKIIQVDDNFVFTITDKVKNYGNESRQLQSVSKVCKTTKQIPESFGFFNGPIGYFNKQLREIEYKDIEDKKEIEYSSEGGWFGISEKYWLVAFIPEQNSSYDVSYSYAKNQDATSYIVQSADKPFELSPSAEYSVTHRLFIGAKEIKTLDKYEEILNIPHFDLVIDFGRLYILTKPLLYAVSYAKNFVGNMGFGILLITLLLKILLFPLANKSYRSMNKMKALQPKMKALQEKYANDRARLGTAVSELYRKEKINPIGGCLPMFLQWPILFALYKVLYISIEMRQAPFIGWIHDLSIADPWSVLTLGGFIPVSLPTFLQIGIWPLLMGFSMWIQQKMGPAPADPSQAKMMLMMPIIFTFMFAQLPSGLVIYWTFSNLLAIAQQYIIQKSDENNKEKSERK